MVPAKLVKLAAAAAFAAGVFAISAASAQPQGVAPLSVTGGHPTSVTVSVKGKDIRAVRKDVDAAAYFVCRNFVGLDGIALEDLNWCADAASAKAMKTYAAAARAGALADTGLVVLAAR
jgi:hypothetical protein